MRWDLEHLQLVIGVGGAIAYWLTQRKAVAAAREQQRQREATPPAPMEDAERTRRIQEEIRRKIAGRRAGTPPPVQAPATTTRPLASPVLAPRPVAEGGLREKLETKLAQAQAREAARAAEQSRRQQLEAQVRKLETDRAAIERRAAGISLAARAEGKASAVAQTAADTLAARGSR